MRKHDQTEFEAGKGNALQACVASMIGADQLTDVVDFVKEGGSDYATLLNARLGSNMPPLAFLKVALKPKADANADADESAPRLDTPTAPGTRCLCAGKSPRGDFKHVVVAEVAEDGATLRFLHDPHPDRTNVESPFAWAGFFVVR